MHRPRASIYTAVAVIYQHFWSLLAGCDGGGEIVTVCVSMSSASLQAGFQGWLGVWHSLGRWQCIMASI
jgi:hypothetical protein